MKHSIRYKGDPNPTQYDPCKDTRPMPYYWTGTRYDGHNYKICDVVEMRALRHALDMVKADLSEEEKVIFYTLKELVK